MGLCKCPKRKVTNLFCYEHRVNVCLHCMVTNHPKCIVQSYILWLQDSDYDRTCTLCNKDLVIDDCVRLMCYHVFHWNCLDQYARKLPDTTAPAGYVCPTCSEPIFPKSNVISPVAVALREKIASVNWARIGLGLPLLSEEGDVKPNSEDVSGDTSSLQNHLSAHSDTVVHMDDNSNTFSRNDVPSQVPRRILHSLDNIQIAFLDADENKYRRRSPTYWLCRWIKSLWSSVKHQRGAKKYCIFIVLMALFLFIIVMILSKLGRIVTEDDPSLSINSNPYIRTDFEQ